MALSPLPLTFHHSVHKAASDTRHLLLSTYSPCLSPLTYCFRSLQSSTPTLSSLTLSFQIFLLSFLLLFMDYSLLFPSLSHLSLCSPTSTLFFFLYCISHSLLSDLSPLFSPSLHLLLPPVFSLIFSYLSLWSLTSTVSSFNLYLTLLSVLVLIFPPSFHLSLLQFASFYLSPSLPLV